MTFFFIIILELISITIQERGTRTHLNRENKLLKSLTLDEIWPDYVLKVGAVLTLQAGFVRLS